VTKFFAPNLDSKGRLLRAAGAAALIGAGLWLHETGGWLCFALVAAGGFVLFEAVRGWCVMRACGIKTKI
jgi:hypothetical protein